MAGERRILTPLSGAVFLSGCIVVFIFTGSFKANGVLFDDAVIQYKTSFTLAGGAYVSQFALSFMVAGIGGSALDGFSYRFLGISGGFLFGLGFVCHGVFGHKLWHLFANMTLTAFGGGLLHFALFMSYIEHFQDKFSVAFSTRELSTYIGVSVMPPLMEVLRSFYGLQGSYLILGAIAWNCVVCGLLLKSPPYRTSTRSLCEELRFLQSKINCCYSGHYNEPFSNESVLKRLQIQLWKLANIFSLAPAIKHPSFAIFLLIHSLFYYTFTAWALFLVPFGISIGFSTTVAVYLSTAGGIGGFVGKLLAIAVFHFKKMNSITGALIPSLICCVGLAGYIFATDYLSLLIYSSLCGFSLAYADSALNGMIPRYLCENHLKQGSAISYLFGGVFMQLGGILSGAILDVQSSYSLVFGAMIGFNVFICVLSTILQCAFDEDKVKTCAE